MSSRRHRAPSRWSCMWWHWGSKGPGIHDRPMGHGAGDSIVLIIAASIAAIALLAAANRVHLRIMDLVNQKLPQTRRYPGPGDPEGTWTAQTWRSPTTRKLHRDYRELYPDEPLVQLYWVLVAAGFGCILVAC